MHRTIIFTDLDKWVAPAWLARNLIAHLLPSFVLAKTRIEDRYSELLAGRDHVVDLSGATGAEMRELRKVAEFARCIVKRRSEWQDSASALEFTNAYDRFLD